MLTVFAEGEMTKDNLQAAERLDAELLGNLTTSYVVNSEISELEDEVGIPMPSWFNAKLPTLSDVGRVGMSLGR
jgi:hypothetical protein